MRFVDRAPFHICGYVIETDTVHNTADLSALYQDFFDQDREAALLKMPGNKRGLYGLMWYTQGHEKYAYLLGIKVSGECCLPEKAVLKTIPKTTYAVSDYPRNKDTIEAWHTFFFEDIPNAGYAANAALNLYFEYFPNGEDGGFELWVPVVMNNV